MGLDGLTRHLMESAVNAVCSNLRVRGRRIYALVLVAHGKDAALARSWERMDRHTALSFAKQMHAEADRLERMALKDSSAELEGQTEARMANGG